VRALARRDNDGPAALAWQVRFLYERIIHEQGMFDEVLKNPRQERTKGFLAGFTDFYF